MKFLLRRNSSGGAERSQGALGAEAAKLDPIESIIQYLAGESKRLEDRVAVLGELGILRATKDLPPERRESLADDIMQERLDPGQRNRRKD